jgi:hypothetical protein
MGEESLVRFRNTRLRMKIAYLCVVIAFLDVPRSLQVEGSDLPTTVPVKEPSLRFTMSAEPESSAQPIKQESDAPTLDILEPHVSRNPSPVPTAQAAVDGPSTSNQPSRILFPTMVPTVLTRGEPSYSRVSSSVPSSIPSDIKSMVPSRSALMPRLMGPTNSPTQEVSSDPSVSVQPSSDTLSSYFSSLQNHPGGPSSSPSLLISDEISGEPSFSTMPSTNPAVFPRNTNSGEDIYLSNSPTNDPTKNSINDPTPTDSEEPLLSLTPSSLLLSTEPSNNMPSAMPSTSESLRMHPTAMPTAEDSRDEPSLIAIPSHIPSSEPSGVPSTIPSKSELPSLAPTTARTLLDTVSPTSISGRPSLIPSIEPSVITSETPSNVPNSPLASETPSIKESVEPTHSASPTFPSSGQPSLHPSMLPSSMLISNSAPSLPPSQTTQPSFVPSAQPSSMPSNIPSSVPSFEFDVIKLVFGTTVAVPGYMLPLQSNMLGGGSRSSGGSSTLGDTDEDLAYSTHIWSFDSIGYRLKFEAEESYDIILGFAETFLPNCQLSNRVFNATVGGHMVGDIDVYASVGCQVAYDILFPGIKTDNLGNIDVLLSKGKQENPFLSVIKVRKAWSEPEISTPPPQSLSAEWLTVDTGSTKPTPRHEACFVTVGDLAYLVGGRGVKPVDVYDPATQTWAMKTGPGIELHHAQCVVAGTKLYVVSAWTGNYPYESNVANIYVYDTVTDSWTTEPGLPESRRRGAAATVYHNGEIFVSHGNRGGHGQHAESLGWFDKYNITSKTWTTNLTDAPNPRDHAGGAIVDGMLCVAGGRDGGVQDFFDAAVLETDCYDFVTGQWEVRASLPQGRGGAAYGQTCDGKLMMAGGEGFDKAWRRVDVFDGTSWTTVADLKENRHGTGIAFSCQCNQAHIASGSIIQGELEIASTETFFIGGLHSKCIAPLLSLISKIHFGSLLPADGYDAPVLTDFFGEYSFWGEWKSISDSDAASAYASHVWTPSSAGYILHLDAHKTYVIKLGFSETYAPNCEEGKRLFSVRVGDNLVSDIDVYAAVGCAKEYNVMVEDIKPNLTSGLLNITLIKSSYDNPFLALLEVHEITTSATISSNDPSTAPSLGPSTDPSTSSSDLPSLQPSNAPIRLASHVPTDIPSLEPTSFHSLSRSNSPSTHCSLVPSSATSGPHHQAPQQAALPSLMLSFGTGSAVDGYLLPSEAAIEGEYNNFDGDGIVIQNTSSSSAYASHIWISGDSLNYTLQLDPSKVYDVTLGFAESYSPNCFEGARVFSASVNEETVHNIDVVKAAGCVSAYDLTFKNISGGAVQVGLARGPAENPFLSLIQVEEVIGMSGIHIPSIIPSAMPSASHTMPISIGPSKAPSNLPTSSAVPSGGSSLELTFAMISFGTGVPVEGYDMPQQTAIEGQYNNFTGSGITILHTATPRTYASHVWLSEGDVFNYTLQLDPSKLFEITLGFAESYVPNCANDTRIFAASVADEMIENIDVFKEVGCKTPYDLLFKNVTGGRVKVSIMRGPSENPFLSLIRVSQVLMNPLDAEAPFKSLPIPTMTGVTSYIPSHAPSASPSTQLPSFASPEVPMLLINFGTGSTIGEYEAAIEGEYNNFDGDGIVIQNTSSSSAYASHIWISGDSLNYTLQLDPSKVYDVTLGFAESYSPNCFEGARVFSASVNEETVHNIDVVKAAGCVSAYDLTFKNISGGAVQVGLARGPAENPFLSLIRVYEANQQMPTGSPTIVPSIHPSTSAVDNTSGPTASPSEIIRTVLDDPSVMVSFGTNLPVDGYSLVPQEDKLVGAFNLFGGEGIAIDNTDVSRAYASHLWVSGDNLTYNLELDARKTYDVTLGFAESYGPNCQNDMRVFSASVGDKTEENIDVFTSAGCRKAYDLIFPDVPGGTLKIVLSRGPAENPFLSLIRAYEVTFQQVSHNRLSSPTTTPSSSIPSTAPTQMPSTLPTPDPSTNDIRSTEPTTTIPPIEPVLKVHFGTNQVIDGYTTPITANFVGIVSNFDGTGIQINNTANDLAYASHFWTSETSVSYYLDLEPSRQYDVSLGFAESYTPNCVKGARVFQATVGSSVHSDIDVFDAVGCKTAYNIPFNNVLADDNGRVFVILSRGVSENPFLSLIEVKVHRGG